MAEDDEDQTSELGRLGPAAADTGLAAAALALARRKRGAKADDRLDAFLDRHGRLTEAQRALVGLQMEHLHEERSIHHRHLELKYFGDRLRIGLQLLLIAFGLAVAIGLAAMVWSAHEDYGLVVEAFSVPPDLAQRGLTGQVVAKQVLDRLAELQTETDSRRAASSYKNDWGDQLKVEIPQTGISFGELHRLLLGWLGHQTRISGEVYRTPAGLSVTARAGEGGASTFAGPDAEVDSLIRQAAEAIYQRTQPYRYATYLQEHGRPREALAILQKLSHDPDPVERAWAHIDIGIVLDSLQSDTYAVANELRVALSIVPGFAPALLNLETTEANLGHDEEALRVGGEAMAAGESMRRHIAPERREAALASLLMIKDRLDGDYSDEIQQALRLEAMTRPASHDTGRDDLPAALALSHDLAAARAAAGRLQPDNPDRQGIPGMVALELGDPVAANLLAQARDMEEGAGGEKILALRVYAPWLAMAEARLGDPAGAQSLISTTPADCYLCERARGVIAAARGDRAEAGRWFAQAIRQGPDLPQAYVDRGSSRLLWGDVSGAIADARRASTVSPHHADAWKLWGDGLARQRRWAEALDKYDKAAKYAPAWSALRQARNAAARRPG